jgi:hypothetical protein
MDSPHLASCHQNPLDLMVVLIVCVHWLYTPLVWQKFSTLNI